MSHANRVRLGRPGVGWTVYFREGGWVDLQEWVSLKLVYCACMLAMWGERAVFILQQSYRLFLL